MLSLNIMRLPSIKIIMVLTSCMLSFSFTSCGEKHHHDEHAEGEEHEHEHEEGVIHFTDKQANEAGLKLETVKSSEFQQAIRVSGQVTVAQGDEAVIVAKSAGIISFMRDHLSEGVAINKGEVLARISSEGVVGGDMVSSNATALKTAKAAYDRARKLFADTIISEKEMHRAQLEYEQAVIAMGGQTSTAKGGTTVTASMTGFVKSIDVRQGEYVQAGQIIATLTKSCNLQLRAEVPEKHFQDIHKVCSANFEMSYGGGVLSLKDLNGHVVSIGRTASEESAYIPLTFEFENRGHIVPGSFADIWLLFTPRTGVISVPTKALTEEQGVFYVYVQADHHDEYEKREVKTGGNNGIRTEILSGLSEGDKVVVNGVYQVKLAATAVSPEAHSHNH